MSYKQIPDILKEQAASLTDLLREITAGTMLARVESGEYPDGERFAILKLVVQSWEYPLVEIYDAPVDPGYRVKVRVDRDQLETLISTALMSHATRDVIFNLLEKTKSR
jgi:hypothetical protein